MPVGTDSEPEGCASVATGLFHATPAPPKVGPGAYPLCPEAASEACEVKFCAKAGIEPSSKPTSLESASWN